MRHLRHVACDDAGRVLNPLLLEGQIHGGIAQGAAQALLEEVRYDDDGNPITSNLADYAFISAAELPSFELVHMETPTSVNPLGAKGIGESGTIGSTPAVQSAVVDARQPPRRAPHRHAGHPERVWQAIAAAQADRPARPLDRSDGMSWIAPGSPGTSMTRSRPAGPGAGAPEPARAGPGDQVWRSTVIAASASSSTSTPRPGPVGTRRWPSCSSNGAVRSRRVVAT